jgi:hypothetical protein
MLMISKVRFDELTLTYRCQPSDASDSRKVAFNQAEKISRIPAARTATHSPPAPEISAKPLARLVATHRIIKSEVPFLDG